MSRIYVAALREQLIESLCRDGFDSHVYKTADLMTALTGDAVAWKNAKAAYYMLLWCRAHSVDPSAKLDVGDEIVVPHNVFGEIPCILIGKGIDGTGKLTFVTKEIVCQHAFDAEEPNNPDTNRAAIGNNRYSQSNILLWLNSPQPAGQWFYKQHEYDAPPNATNTSVNAYADKPGFLCGVDLTFYKALRQTSKVTALNTVSDGGGSETVTAITSAGYTISQKLFLLSKTELGLGNENDIAEGTAYPYFTSADKRSAYLSDYALQNTKFIRATDNLQTKGGKYQYLLRTPVANISTNTRDCQYNGELGSSSAHIGHRGVRPAFVL
jgi:hypothetical protein